MKTSVLSMPFLVGADISAAAGYLTQEYEQHTALFAAQPAMRQRYYTAQASTLANAIFQNSEWPSFTLPDQITPLDGGEPLTVPANLREQNRRGWNDWFGANTFAEGLRQRLDDLEANDNAAVAVAAGLMRFATARFLVRQMLPSGRNVHYQQMNGEAIPAEIDWDTAGPSSSLTAVQDAIAEEGDAWDEERGELLVPYSEYARRFYLPQWVAIGQDDKLLVSSIEEAEALVDSMQHFIAVLHAAVSLAPYMVADASYQQKRYGMLGQLVNQGRALSRCELQDITAEIQRRQKQQTLNRGLSISLPYFDDQALERRLLEIDIVPAGRVMFTPAFVVLACRQEAAKVAQDTRLSPSTRRHILDLLKHLEKTFLK